MTDDPERLVAEALRAHAARTPLPSAQPAAEPADGTSPVLGSYGLLSGSGLRLPGRDEPTVRGPVLGAGDGAGHGTGGGTSRLEPDQPVAFGWVVLLALVLGLAAGAVVGLVTLL